MTGRHTTSAFANRQMITERRAWGRVAVEVRQPSEWLLLQPSHPESVRQESTPNLPFRRWMDDDAHG